MSYRTRRHGRTDIEPSPSLKWGVLIPGGPHDPDRYCYPVGYFLTEKKAVDAAVAHGNEVFLLAERVTRRELKERRVKGAVGPRRLKPRPRA